MSDIRFEETEPGSWRVVAEDRPAFIAAAEGTAASVADPTAPTVSVTDETGIEWSPEQVADLAARSAVEVRMALESAHLDVAGLEALIGATAALRLMALWLLDALAGTDAAGDHEVMGFLQRLAHLLDRAYRARFATVVATPGGGFRLRWTDHDREMVRELSAELDLLLESDDPSVVRLFPPAYGPDVERSRDFDALARTELIESRRAALAVLADALEQTHLDADGLASLMRAVNDLRLVVGTRLDVAEDEDPMRHSDGPDAAAWAAYGRLSRLLSDIVDALGD
ncbi:MAG: DUF2017 family protein [Microthrixaceae bacterium]|nr:DUF2017 family protein [Microthrixaceae bacterium]